MENRLIQKCQFPVLILLIPFLLTKCQKENLNADPISAQKNSSASLKSPIPASPPFNLEVILRGAGEAFGHVKFRQDNDTARVITLETWIRGLAPNHEYKLQRAVDAINVVDGNCTSTTWLTLGKGLTPQTILTDDKGTGKEDLWRSVATLARGSAFDIHFQVIDAATSAVVLWSDCYQYVVR
jgi:hypothetical protein